MDLAKTVQHLASQVASDIWLFKKRKEALLNRTLTYTEVANYYKEHMSDTDRDDEPRSDEATIQKACQVYEKILSIQPVAKTIEWTERVCGSVSPWNSIGKLVEVLQKCKTTPKMEFFFTLTAEGLRQEQLEVGDLSVKKLRGSSGRAGIADIVLLKKAMRDYLTGRWLDEKRFAADDKALARKVFATPKSYAESFVAPCP